MQGGLGMATGLKRALLTNKLAQVGELIGVFIPACAVIMVARPLIGDNPLARHGVGFVVNVLAPSCSVSSTQTGHLPGSCRWPSWVWPSECPMLSFGETSG